MRQVTIQVHPLTRRVLLCEYGAEPFIFPNHDFTFRLLTNAPIRNRAVRNIQKLTSTINLFVDEAFARHIEQNQRSIGLTLLSFHFQTLCRFADSALQIQGYGHVKAAIERWLLIHGVDESEYAADTAYKLWQRHAWNLKEKNPVFFGHSRGKSAGIVSKKIRIRANLPTPLNGMCMSVPEIEIELAASRFVASLEACFRRPPKKIEHHARIYYYMHVAGLSCRAVASRLGITKSTASYAQQTIARRAQQNRTFGKLLAESLPCALPGAV